MPYTVTDVYNPARADSYANGTGAGKEVGDLNKWNKSPRLRNFTAQFKGLDSARTFLNNIFNGVGENSWAKTAWVRMRLLNVGKGIYRVVVYYNPSFRGS